jgi:hypothetical protein
MQYGHKELKLEQFNKKLKQNSISSQGIETEQFNKKIETEQFNKKIETTIQYEYEELKHSFNEKLKHVSMANQKTNWLHKLDKILTT